MLCVSVYPSVGPVRVRHLDFTIKVPVDILALNTTMLSAGTTLSTTLDETFSVL